MTLCVTTNLCDLVAADVATGVTGRPIFAGLADFSHPRTSVNRSPPGVAVTKQTAVAAWKYPGTLAVAMEVTLAAVDSWSRCWSGRNVDSGWVDEERELAEARTGDLRVAVALDWVCWSCKRSSADESHHPRGVHPSSRTAATCALGVASDTVAVGRT